LKTKPERFSLLQAAQESKQNVFIFKNDIKTKPKRCKLRQGYLNTKKHLVVSKNFLKRTRTKAFGPKFSSTDRKRFVSIQNFV
jgi:hypothetical protein